MDAVDLLVEVVGQPVIEGPGHRENVGHSAVTETLVAIDVVRIARAGHHLEGRVPTELSTMSSNLLDALQDLRARLEIREPAVVPGGALQREIGDAPDPDGDRRRRNGRRHLESVESIELALVLDHLPTPELPHHLE